MNIMRDWVICGPVSDAPYLLHCESCRHFPGLITPQRYHLVQVSFKSHLGSLWWPLAFLSLLPTQQSDWSCWNGNHTCPSCVCSDLTRWPSPCYNDSLQYLPVPCLALSTKIPLVSSITPASLAFLVHGTHPLCTALAFTVPSAWHTLPLPQSWLGCHILRGSLLAVLSNINHKSPSPMILPPSLPDLPPLNFCIM